MSQTLCNYTIKISKKNSGKFRQKNSPTHKPVCTLEGAFSHIASLAVGFKGPCGEFWCGDALRTPKERLAPKENSAGWFFKKNLPWGTVLNFGQRRRQVLVEAPERVTPRA